MSAFLLNQNGGFLQFQNFGLIILDDVDPVLWEGQESDNSIDWDKTDAEVGSEWSKPTPTSSPWTPQGENPTDWN